MPRFFLKPVLWNTDQYQRPSGFRATGGYPTEEGYGHEEWNNNVPVMRFIEKGVPYRAFHTERLGNAPLTDIAGDIFLFMIASHDRIQQLVGVAGRASCLIDEEQERKKLAERLRLQDLWQDVWKLPRVKELNGNDDTAFLEKWDRDLDWIPNWKCPEDYFMWLDPPATLDPQRITGKNVLPRMFNQYMELSAEQATRIMLSVENANRTEVWHRLVETFDTLNNVELDVRKIQARTDLPETTKEALINARRGQGAFRTQVLSR